MHVVVQKSLLLEALKKVVQFSGKGVICELVKISVKGNEMILAATNFDAYATVKIETITTITPGAIATKIKDLNGFLSKVKSTSVELEMEKDSVLSVKASNINYHVVPAPADEFPLMPELTFNSFVLSASEYIQILSNTTYAVAKSESRPVLRGVNITAQNKGASIRFVATDSHRLGLYELKQRVHFEFNVTPLGYVLDKTLKVLNKNTTTVRIGISAQYTKIHFDNMDIYISNAEGNYPDTSRLIPDSFKTTVEIDTKETVEALSILNSIAKSTRDNAVKLDINGKLELKTTDGIKSMSAILEGKKSGDDLSVTSNLVYMVDALKALDKKTVTISFCDSNRPFILEGNGSAAKHLILPVKSK